MTIVAAVAAMALAAGAAPAAAVPAAGGSAASARAAAACSGRLAVAVRLPTRNARALQRVGMVRAIAAGRVRDLRVRLERRGRTLAQGVRTGAFSGATAVRLRFRRAARPGRVAVVASGRRAGCAARRSARRSLILDRNDLPVAVRAADRDVSDGRFALTLRRTRARALTDLRLRVLDRHGDTIAEHAREAPLGAPLRVELAPAERPPAGRYAVLVTADVHGERARAAAAASVELVAGRYPRPGPAAPAPGPPPPSRPGAGAVVQQVGVSWSGGRWEGADSAGFAVPGIGAGQIVCRPDTQWIRVMPADRSRDVAMLLWTFRDWGGGSEGAVREAQMTRYTSPEFNEGMNKFAPPEKRSHGTFFGVVGDGLPAAGTFGAGRAPTEVRLSWSWDFEDPAGARCGVSATFVSEGPGTVGAIARGLSLAWNGEAGVPAGAGAATPVPGLGTVRLRCAPRPDGVRQVVVEPLAPLVAPVAAIREGSVRTDAPLGDPPYVVALPGNGLVELAAAGGQRVLLASRWKVNDPDPAQNSCRLWGVAVSARS